MIELQKTRKYNFLKKLQLFFLLLLVLILASFVFLSPVLAGDHQCADGHCIVCLLSSNTTANLVCAVVFFSLVVSVTVISVRQHNENRSETLITLKRKLTN